MPKLVDLANDVPWIFTGMVFSRDYIAANRETVKNFLRAYAEGVYIALSDEARAKALDLVLDGRPHVVGVDFRAEPLRRGNGLQPGDAGARAAIAVTASSGASRPPGTTPGRPAGAG